MIDFKLNDIGDITLNESENITPFRINFAAKKYSLFKIDFITKSIQENPNIKDRLKIYFNIDTAEEDKEYKIDYLTDDDETCQEIEIRLKTELNELSRYYESFGSELSLMRHRDLINKSNHDKIAETSKSALSDINENISVNVYRTFSTGNFQIENLNINVSNPDNSVSYTYSI